MTAPRTRIALAVIAGLAVIGLGAIAIPRPPSLSSDTVGDPELITRVGSLLAEDGALRERLVVVEIDGNETRLAGFGADADTEFEIGSVTKTFTAALLADSIERGEVRADTPLGGLLDLGDAPAAEITLDELASHRSGLPRLPLSPGFFARSWLSGITAGDPYPADPDAPLDAARSARLDGRRGMEYSNLGSALLGQALAAAAGIAYPTLVEDRILAPLGLDATTVPTSPEELAADAPIGRTASGRASAPWTLGGYAPAGSIRSTAADLEGFVRAALDGSAPGVDALEPRFDTGEGDRVGYSWFVTEVQRPGAEAVEVTWHNGGTGGYASMVALDRATDRAVIVLSSTAVSVDALAFELLVEGAR